MIASKMSRKPINITERMVYVILTGHFFISTKCESHSISVKISIRHVNGYQKVPDTLHDLNRLVGFVLEVKSQSFNQV